MTPKYEIEFKKLSENCDYYYTAKIRFQRPDYDENNSLYKWDQEIYNEQEALYFKCVDGVTTLRINKTNNFNCVIASPVIYKRRQVMKPEGAIKNFLTLRANNLIKTYN